MGALPRQAGGYHSPAADNRRLRLHWGRHSYSDGYGDHDTITAATERQGYSYNLWNRRPATKLTFERRRLWYVPWYPWFGRVSDAQVPWPFPLTPPKLDFSLGRLQPSKLRLTSSGGTGGLTRLLLRLRRHLCSLLTTPSRRHSRRMSVVTASTTISNFVCELARLSQTQPKALELNRDPAADAKLDSQASPPYRSSLALPPDRGIPLRMPDRAGVPRPPTVSNG